MSGQQLMYLLASQSTVVQRPIAEVFAYLSDMTNFPDWFPGVLTVAHGNQLATDTVGKTYIETVKTPRGIRQIELEVKECEVNRRFVTEGNYPPLMPRMELHCKAVSGTSTRVSWCMYSRNEKLLPKLLILPLAKRVIGRRALEAMARLKHRMEVDAVQTNPAFG